MPRIRLVLAALLLVIGAALPGRAEITVEVQGDAEAGAEPEAIRLYGASYALVIGIDRYTAGWPPLRNAVHDAELVAEGLRAIGFDVTLATDLGSDELRRTLKEFLIRKGAEPDARLFVWYAGHGHSEHGEGFLVPADAPLPADPDFALLSLPMRDVGTMVRLARAKHVMAVFDSCFAGTIFESRGTPPPPAITRATLMPVRQFLSSGEADQTVSDDGSFRELFLRAIGGQDGSDSNGDGYVTGTELGAYLADRVTNLTHGAQTPRYGKMLDVSYDRGDFVFVLPSRTAPEAEPATVQPAQDGSTEAAYEIAFWDAIKNSTVAADYEAYLQAYPQGRFVPLANARIATLSAAATGTEAATPPAEAPAPEPEAPQAVTSVEPQADPATQTAAVEPSAEPVPPPPAPAIAALDEQRFAQKAANVREAPDQTAARIARLAAGDSVRVTGKVEGAPWFAVELPDGRVGYVHADLLGTAPPAASSQSAAAPADETPAFSEDNPFASSSGTGSAGTDPDNPFATGASQ